MKFSVLALDYDGTIAKNDRPDPQVLAAIDTARMQGIAVLLVTGRTLPHLQQDAGNLDMFDVVVAENGAVLRFAGDRTRILTRPPSRALMDELCRAEVSFGIGECILEADAVVASTVLRAIRKLELPLALAFNRSRVMILPQGISKATGLREALDTLRLSPHNCLGIGDAENDYEMLDFCEVGVAVSWGSKALREIADDIVEGDGPPAVADYIRRALEAPHLPRNRRGRRRLLLGETFNGRELGIPLHGRNILIAGDPRSGKSWVAGLICEQLILKGYCVCVIDPEGDYAPLEALPGVVVFGGEEPPPRLTDLRRALRYPDISVVIDLSRLDHADKVGYLRDLLPMLAGMRRRAGQPHWIVVDEAHYFLDQPDYQHLVDTDLAAYLLVTHRVSNLHPNLLQTVDSIVVTQITDPREAHRITSMFGRPGQEAEWESLLAQLGVEEAALLSKPGTEEGTLEKFLVAGRLTPHVRHRAKYLDVPMPEWHGFVFTCNGHPIGEPARTLKEFVSMIARIPAASLEDHARRGDFSRWIGGVLGDHPLSVEIRKVEKAFARGSECNLREDLIAPIRERYELTGVSMLSSDPART